MWLQHLQTFSLTNYRPPFVIWTSIYLFIFNVKGFARSNELTENYGALYRVSAHCLAVQSATCWFTLTTLTEDFWARQAAVYGEKDLKPAKTHTQRLAGEHS